jgi:hypothetical protein
MGRVSPHPAFGRRHRSYDPATGAVNMEELDKYHYLVAQLGPGVLGVPGKHGFDLLAWLLPIVGVLGGAAVLGVLAWRWTREREPEPTPQRWSLNGHPLGPDEERRLDDELARFDR